MKYFEINGKQCRALPFNDRHEVNCGANVYIKNIPIKMKNEQLDSKFSKFGKIKSLKIA